MIVLKENFLITQKDIALFAQVAGDPNPIHQDNAVAQAMGLEGAIAHGMFVHCYLLRRLDEWLRAEKQKGQKWFVASTRCRFHEPALVGKSFESILEFSESNPEEAKMNMLFMEGEKKLCQVIANLKKI